MFFFFFFFRSIEIDGGNFIFDYRTRQLKSTDQNRVKILEIEQVSEHTVCTLLKERFLRYESIQELSRDYFLYIVINRFVKVVRV